MRARSTATLSAISAGGPSPTSCGLLKEAGAGPEHLVRLTWFVTSKPDYLASGREIGAAYRDTIGKNFPTMTVIFVSALIDDRAKIEIEATAFVPEAK